MRPHKKGLVKALAFTIAALISFIGVVATPAHASVSARGPLGNNAYTIRPVNNQGRCMDVTDVSQANGARIQLYTCLGNGQTNQGFYFWSVDGTSNDYEITPMHSWKCLDVWDWSMNDGAPMQQWDCLGGTNQIFTVTYTPYGYEFRPRHNPSYYVGYYPAAGQGDPVRQSSYAQRWVLYTF